MIDLKAIGTRIKERRVQAGWTQAELADLLPISKGTLGKIENGNNNFRIETISQIAHELGVYPMTLIDGDDRMHVYSVEVKVTETAPEQHKDFILGATAETLTSLVFDPNQPEETE